MSGSRRKEYIGEVNPYFKAKKKVEDKFEIEPELVTKVMKNEADRHQESMRHAAAGRVLEHMRRLRGKQGEIAPQIATERKDGGRLGRERRGRYVSTRSKP